MKEEGRERARRLTLAHHSGYKPTPLPAPLETKEYDALEKAWAQVAALEPRSPWEHAPHLWRRSLETLLRAEELARAGDADTSRKLRGEADDLIRRIERSQVVALASSRLSIPQAEALGFVPSSKEKESLASFIAILKRNDFDAAAQWAGGIEKGAANVRPRTPCASPPGARRSAMSILPRLSASKPLLAALEDAAEPRRPAEGHFLAMLLDKSASSRGEDMGRFAQALKVRLLAEEAAIGAGEAVLPWVRPLAEAGDKARRVGQDLLFASQPEKRAEAGRLLDEAEKRYGEAVAAATEAWLSMKECHAALARLPFASRWLASQREEDETRRAVALWATVHELHAALDAVRPVAELAKLRKVVADGMGRLRGEIDRERASLAELGDKQEDWHRGRRPAEAARRRGQGAAETARRRGPRLSPAPMRTPARRARSAALAPATGASRPGKRGWPMPA